LQNNIFWLIIVSSVRAIRIICEKWKSDYDYLPDVVIVEGPKAGVLNIL